MSEAFRAAGEFYGHLLTAVPCGDLTMRREGQIFVYQWSFEFVDDEHSSVEFEATDAELMQTRFFGDLAKEVAAGWSREIKEPRG